MLEQQLIERVKSGQTVSFQDTMAVIAAHYDYFPTEFSNGLNPVLINEAGRNEGSCKIFAFAKLQGLNPSETLALFGDYYLIDVLGNPDGQDHQNIRNFMRDGWNGIHFQGEALKSRHAD